MGALIRCVSVDESFVLSVPRTQGGGVADSMEVIEGRSGKPSVGLDDAPSLALAAQMVVDEDLTAADQFLSETDKEKHKERLKSIIDRAECDGYAVGFAKGEKAGADAFAEAIEVLVRAKASMDRSCNDVLLNAETIVGAIVFEAVCKIVGRCLTTDEGCRAVVEEVVSRVRRDSVVSLHMAPKDVERICLTAGQAANSEIMDRIAELRIEPDDSVELGGCVVQLIGGSIDGRIETQFRVLAQSLKDAARCR